MERVIVLSERLTPIERIAEYKRVILILVDTECKGNSQKKLIKDCVGKCFQD